MKPSVALVCLALGVCAHALSIPVDEVSTSSALPSIEPVPTETNPPAVDDTTTTPPVIAVDDTTTTPPAPIVDDTTTTPPAPVVDDTTTTPPAPVVDDTTTTPPAPVVVDTTTIPPPPYECYDCNSGMHVNNGWVNPACPVDGQIPYPGTTVSCQGLCVSSVSGFPPGTTNRGCERFYYYPPTFDTSPGCRTLDNIYLCFSRGDRSNVQNLTAVSQYYIDKYNRSKTTPSTSTTSSTQP